MKVYLLVPEYKLGHVTRPMDAERLLRSLGVTGKLVGFSYTIYMVGRVLADAQSLQLITKCLYPETARHFGTTGPGVERAVRTLIHAVWRGEDHHMLEQIAGTHLTQPPTNAEFIDMLAGFLRQCELCDEEAEE